MNNIHMIRTKRNQTEHYYGCVIRIYPSATGTLALYIKPDQETSNIVTLAHLAVRGQEHYTSVPM